MKTLAPHNLKKGTRFSAEYADGFPVWEVIELVGKGVYRCQVVQEEPYAGVQRAFFRHEIQYAIETELEMVKGEMESEKFYASLTPGETVHYNHGFGRSYIRCEVDSNHALIPIALVGDWRKEDYEIEIIHGRFINYLPPVAKDLITKTPLTGGAHLIYESSSENSYPDYLNPRTLQPIELNYSPEDIKIVEDFIELEAKEKANSSSVDIGL
jgi:hypothetical protein